MHYDIIIIGGGLVGKSIACALRHSSLSIALIDAAKMDKPDPRLIALNYGSHSFLEKIGIWKNIAPYAEPIEQVHVSHRGQFGTTTMLASEINLPALGYVVRAKKINEALDSNLSQLTELRPATVKAVDPQKDKTNIIIEKEGQNMALSANLVLAADGTYSTVRSLLNFETETTDYQQKAIVTPVNLQRDHHHIAYERFLDDGAIAMLPLKNETPACAMIWTAANSQIDNLMSLSDSEFLKILQKQFGYRLGKLIAIEQRATFPLHFIHVKNPIKENVILIGNAAHTIHPVGAQGLNLALYEIAHITQALLENHKADKPLIHGLAEKLPKLQPKINLMFSHYLNPLFSSNWFAIHAAKQAGMMALDLCLPLKNKLSRMLAMEKVRWLE